MESQSLSNWIQALTAVAVLIGLALVVWELQQTRDLARAQLISDNHANLFAQHTSLMGENPAAIINKACVQPEKLTGEDITVLNSYFWIQLTTPLRIRNIGIETDLYDPEVWRSWYQGPFLVIAGTRYGRYWWSNINTYLEGIDPELVEFGNEYLARNGTADTCSDYPQGYLDSLSEIND